MQNAHDSWGIDENLYKNNRGAFKAIVVYDDADPYEQADLLNQWFDKSWELYATCPGVNYTLLILHL